MIDEIKNKVTLLIVNKEQFNLLKHVLTILGEEIVDIDNDNVFNQLAYVDFSTTRNKWMIRSIVYENGKNIFPLIPIMHKLCDSNNIEFFTAYSEGVTCVEADGEVFTFTT